MLCPSLIYFIEDIEIDVLVSELASCIIITANNQKKYEARTGGKRRTSLLYGRRKHVEGDRRSVL